MPATAAEAIAEADIVITMLSDGPTVHDLLFDQELAAAMKAGTLLIDMSSIKPSEARTHAALMRERACIIWMHQYPAEQKVLKQAV